MPGWIHGSTAGHAPPSRWRGFVASAAVAAAVLAGCSSSGSADRAGPCEGFDREAWDAALADAEAGSSGSASGSGAFPSDPDAVEIANDLVDSECLVGLERDEVQELLGGDGESYYLGFPALVALDTESLVIVYQDGVVEEARIVQG